MTGQLLSIQIFGIHLRVNILKTSCMELYSNLFQFTTALYKLFVEEYNFYHSCIPWDVEYLDTILWGSFPDDCPNIGPQFKQEMPRIAPITKMWQRQKCDLLGIPFHSPSIHPTTVAGHLLCSYQPWEIASIEEDGNCFFRLSENSHWKPRQPSNLRSLIKYYIAARE